jgi:hypothetical protein
MFDFFFINFRLMASHDNNDNPPPPNEAQGICIENVFLF